MVGIMDYLMWPQADQPTTFGPAPGGILGAGGAMPPQAPLQLPPSFAMPGSAQPRGGAGGFPAASMDGRVSWGDNPVVTTAALSLLGAPTLRQGMQDFARNAPAAISLKNNMQGDERKRQAINAFVRSRSGSLRPGDAELIQAYPDLAATLFKSEREGGGDTNDIRNYTYYQQQELAAGRKPLPFQAWVSQSSGSDSTGTERIARALMDEAKSRGEDLSFSDALRLAQRAPDDERDLLAREQMALKAAQGDEANFGIDPAGTLAAWREYYGLPKDVPDYRQTRSNNPQPNRDGTGADRNTVAVPRPAGVPAGSAFSPSRNMWRSPDGQLFNAAGLPVAAGN